MHASLMACVLHANPSWFCATQRTSRSLCSASFCACSWASCWSSSSACFLALAASATALAVAASHSALTFAGNKHNGDAVRRSCCSRCAYGLSKNPY